MFVLKSYISQLRRQLTVCFNLSLRREEELKKIVIFHTNHEFGGFSSNLGLTRKY